MCIRDRCTSTLTDWPWTVAINLSFFTSLVMYFPDATWYVSILVSSFLSCNKLSNAPEGSFANAASVGAKTVNGPGPLSVSTRSAACTAFTSVVKFSASIAVSTIFFIFQCLLFCTKGVPLQIQNKSLYRHILCAKKETLKNEKYRGNRN